MKISKIINQIRNRPLKTVVPKIARKIVQIPRQVMVAAGRNGERRVTLKDGSVFIADPRRGWIDWNLAVRGIYEPGTLNLIAKLLKPGGTFIDVGANMGLMSITAARCVGPSGKVIAFEPDSGNFSRLAAARHDNCVPHVLPLPFALGTEPGEATINRAPDNDGGLSSIKDIPGFVGGEAIPVTTLDAMIETLGLDRIDLIKIDVEGAENDVIMGGIETIRRLRPSLIIEMINEGAVAAGKFLIDLGYRAFVSEGKDELECHQLKEIEPGLLDHDNMIFVHAEHCAQLADKGLQVETWRG